MQFIDLAAQQKKIRQDLEKRIMAVLDSGRYINGPEVTELEEKLAAYAGTKHAMGCSSGTDALLLPLMALGVGPGDAVFTTPFTFIATAEVISMLGATPVFVDIDPDTFNIDVNKLEKAIEAFAAKDDSIYPLPRPCDPDSGKVVSLFGGTCSLKPKGIIPVDLFGLCADYDAINALAKKHDMFVLEDAAQSFGAEYKGRMSCSLGTAAATSFFPAKPLGGYGDGGMVFTDDGGLDRILRSLRVHGQGSNKYDNVRIGMNGRLDTIQAAILLAKFDLFPTEVKLRQEVAARYTEPLSTSGKFTAPDIPDGYLSVYAQYTLMVGQAEERDSVLAHLKEAGIPSAVYYPKPLHLQEAFGHLGYEPGDFPISDEFAGRVFSLPMHPYLEAEDQEKIVDCLLKWTP